MILYVCQIWYQWLNQKIWLNKQVLILIEGAKDEESPDCHGVTTTLEKVSME